MSVEGLGAMSKKKKLGIVLKIRLVRAVNCRSLHTLFRNPLVEQTWAGIMPAALFCKPARVSEGPRGKKLE